MNQLYKRCSCGEFFPSEVLSIQRYCPKCRNMKTTKQEAYIDHIKKLRYIDLSIFDVYDLKRPLKNRNGYERVCRNCGEPLPRKKDGSYSHYWRYCSKKECNGYDFFSKFNWTICRNNYLAEIKENQKEKIIKKLEKRSIDIRESYRFILCENCGKFCKAREIGNCGYWDHRFKELKLEQINVHHIIPVHTLTEENIMLLFDKSNFICLCEECHKNQDHQLSKISKINANNKKMTQWL